tara:strand:+ start:1324 stop:1881 length:558 start_codon:yes stop_codon:yes gene_type:complete
MNASEFCGFIFDLRKSAIERTKFTEIYPWHVNTIKGYEKDRLPDVDYLYALAEVTHFDFYELIRMRLRAGVLSRHEGYVFNKPPFIDEASKPENVELEVSNDTMSPTISPGATITIDKKQTSIIQGKIYAFEFNGEITPRRVQRGLTGELTLISDNPMYDNIRLDKHETDSAIVIGRVISCLNPL